MDIVRRPVDEDAGHCEIVGPDGRPCPHTKAVTRLLAARAVILPEGLIGGASAATIRGYLRGLRPDAP